LSEIFVFGSNLAGRHGKGAALFAAQYYGAVYGQGAGRTGNAYALPTKGNNMHVLSLQVIKAYITDFLEYARTNPDLRFYVTKVGCGLAGYTSEQIAPMFKGAPENCRFDQEWIDILKKEENGST